MMPLQLNLCDAVNLIDVKITRLSVEDVIKEVNPTTGKIELNDAARAKPDNKTENNEALTDALYCITKKLMLMHPGFKMNERELNGLIPLEVGMKYDDISVVFQMKQPELHETANLIKLHKTWVLLEKGADVNKVIPKTREIALHAAARAVTQNIPKRIAAMKPLQLNLCDAVNLIDVKITRLSVEDVIKVNPTTGEIELHDAAHAKPDSKMENIEALIDALDCVMKKRMLMEPGFMLNETEVNGLIPLEGLIKYDDTNVFFQVKQPELHETANLIKLHKTRVLLEKGADVNKVIPKTREIALHAAARAVTENIPERIAALGDIVLSLIEYGSNLYARDAKGLTPLEVAIEYNNISVAALLIVNQLGMDQGNATYNKTFHIAFKTCNKDLVEICLDYGANVKARDKAGLNPCHMAVNKLTLSGTSCEQDKQLEMFKLLWKHNFPFDLTLPPQSSRHPNPPSNIVSLVGNQNRLFNALQTQQDRNLQIAIDKGAVVHCCSTYMPYPLHYISSKGNAVIMKILLEHGVQPNTLDERGETPLHVAAKGGFLNCCLYLLEYGAVYNCKSSKCPKTPLQLAKRNGHTEVVTLLTTVGEHFKELGKKRLTPRMKLYTAITNCCGRDGRTLMERALHHDSKNFAQYLMKLRLKNKCQY